MEATLADYAQLIAAGHGDEDISAIFRLKTALFAEPAAELNMARRASTDTRSLNLPDFCAARAVLAVVLIVTLTAIVLAVARQSSGLSFWLDLARSSLFLLWAGMGSAAALCLLRTRLATLPLPVASALALGSVLLVIALVSLGVLWLGSSAVLGPRATNLLLPVAPQGFFAASLGIGAIVGALALRYFYVTGEWRRNVELQARARVRALQARIRPHFLFNSMNTIAALTRTDPARAEEAVEDLADLFRANLNEKRSSITLKEELEVARIYQRIEQLRLGERLARDLGRGRAADARAGAGAADATAP